MAKTIHHSNSGTILGTTLTGSKGSTGSTTGTATINSSTLQPNTHGIGQWSTTVTPNQTTLGYYPYQPFNTTGYINTVDPQMIAFVEFLFELLDVDLDYISFCAMSEGERAIFVRQYVIGNIIK